MIIRLKSEAEAPSRDSCASKFTAAVRIFLSMSFTAMSTSLGIADTIVLVS